MIFRNKNKELVYDQLNAKGYKLADTTLNELVKLEIEKGGEIPVHTLPIHVSFYVVSGDGTAIVSEQKIKVSKGDVISINAYVNRGWVNEEDDLLELLVCKEKQN